MNAKLRQVMRGTDALWGAVAWPLSLLIACILFKLFEKSVTPYQAEFEPNPQLVSLFNGIPFWTIVAILSVLVVRSQVLKPILRLRQRCTARADFDAFSRKIARRALPHALIMAAVLLPFFFYFGASIIWVQFAFLVLAEHLLRKHRGREVRALADDLIAKGAVA